MTDEQWQLFGRGLQERRQEKNWTQDDVAAACHVTRTMVSYWEIGRRRPTWQQLRTMARLYDVPWRLLLPAKSDLK